MVPYIAVGDHVLVARVRQPGITPKLLNIWTRPWRVVSETGEHVYDIEGKSRGCGRMLTHR